MRPGRRNGVSALARPGRAGTRAALEHGQKGLPCSHALGGEGGGRKSQRPRSPPSATLASASPSSKWGLGACLRGSTKLRSPGDSGRSRSRQTHLLRDASFLVHGSQVAQNQLGGLSFPRTTLSANRAKEPSENPQVSKGAE